MSEWIRAVREDDLWPDVIVPVCLPPDERGRPREALVLLDQYGAVRAYLNRCEHIHIPLDAGSRDFLDPSGHLRCGTHGALYRREDGYCVAGPCSGESLLALPVRIEAGYVEVRAPSP